MWHGFSITDVAFLYQIGYSTATYLKPCHKTNSYKSRTRPLAKSIGLARTGRKLSARLSSRSIALS